MGADDAETAPLSYHAFGEECMSDLLRLSNANAVIDLMPNTGAMATVAREKNIACLGLCHNDCHRECLATTLRCHTLLQVDKVGQ